MTALSVPTGMLVAFALVLTRASAMLLALPVIGGEIVPVRIRAAVALALSSAALLGRPALPAGGSTSALALLGEALAGAALGLLVRLSLTAAELAAELVSSQAGFGFDRVMNPWGDDQAPSLGNLVSVTTGMLLFATGAYRDVVRGFLASFGAVPAGSLATPLALTGSVLARGGDLFAAGTRLAAPVAGALVATQLALALVARVAPQLNVWSLGFLVTSAMAVLALATYAPALVDELTLLWRGGLADLALRPGY